jgi:hypothetical protein
MLRQLNRSKEIERESESEGGGEQSSLIWKESKRQFQAFTGNQADCWLRS